MDLLWDEQPREGSAGPSNLELIALAESAGAEDGGECIVDVHFKGWAERATAFARGAGVESTPTVLVDGEELLDRSPAALRAAVIAAS